MDKFFSTNNIIEILLNNKLFFNFLKNNKEKPINIKKEHEEIFNENFLPIPKINVRISNENFWFHKYVSRKNKNKNPLDLLRISPLTIFDNNIFTITRYYTS